MQQHVKDSIADEVAKAKARAKCLRYYYILKSCEKIVMIQL